jgi:hypothetical protein
LGAGRQRLVDVLVAVKSRKHDDAGGGIGLADFQRGLHPALERHP